MCRTPICQPNCSRYHGNCTEPQVCTCDIGWTVLNNIFKITNATHIKIRINYISYLTTLPLQGQYCSKCIPLPGCQNGYCNIAFECKCKKGWTGMYCNMRKMIWYIIQNAFYVERNINDFSIISLRLLIQFHLCLAICKKGCSKNGFCSSPGECL